MFHGFSTVSVFQYENVWVCLSNKNLMIWLVAATQLLFDPLSAAIAAPISNSQGDKYPLYFLHHEFINVGFEPQTLGWKTGYLTCSTTPASLDRLREQCVIVVVCTRR